MGSLLVTQLLGEFSFTPLSSFQHCVNEQLIAEKPMLRGANITSSHSQEESQTMQEIHHEREPVLAFDLLPFTL